MKILQHNVETNEVIERDATPDEIAQFELLAARREAQLAEAEAKAQAKADLLDRLGITAEEAKLLLS